MLQGKTVSMHFKLEVNKSATDVATSILKNFQLDVNALLDFDVILKMIWLHSYYASIDCRTRIVKFFCVPE